MTDAGVFIVGGGLSGMALADHLTQASVPWKILEADAKLGGRIRSFDVNSHRGTQQSYSIGPTQFWPNDNRTIALAKRLNLGVCTAASQGKFIFQAEDGTIHTDMNFDGNSNTKRFPNGFHSITEKIAELLPSENIFLNNTVSRLEARNNSIQVTIKSGGVKRQSSVNSVVLALPPRTALRDIEFVPELPENLKTLLENIPTAGAGQTSILVIYEQPFWRQLGLSGNSLSQMGPLSRTYDVSPEDETFGVIQAQFGELNILETRDWNSLLQSALLQLETIFELGGRKPISVLKDYIQNDSLSVAKTTETALPISGESMVGSFFDVWGGRLLFAGAETSKHHSGTLEGALESAASVARKLLTTRISHPLP